MAFLKDNRGSASSASCARYRPRLDQRVPGVLAHRMADILSLSKARKAKARADKDAAAAANRAKFGRTKAERLADESRKSLADKLIDAHKREP